MSKSVSLSGELFMISHKDFVSCIGVKYCFDQATALVEQMNAAEPKGSPYRFVAPTKDQYGTIECYETYKSLLKHFASHPASKKTWFDPGTTPKVKKTLEDARKDYFENRSSADVLRIFLGDPTTGRDWCEEYDVVGYIGRSTGSIKVPLLIEPLRNEYGELTGADGGGAVSSGSIIRIINVSKNTELYRHKNYQLPVFELVNGDLTDFPFEIWRDGSVQARFKTNEDALEYVAFMQGFKMAMPFRTVKEYREEMEE